VPDLGAGLAARRVRARSLDLRSWEAASEPVRGWEASGEVGVVKPEVPSVAEAVTKFIEDANARHLAGETVRKYKNLLEKRFIGWCESKGLRLLKQIDVGAIREFRTPWEDGAVYATKNLERMRAFFRFCEQARWIDRNPAASVKAPKHKSSPTLPFSVEEMKHILDACDRYPGNAVRMKAFVLTMRHSGLRIGDTIALKRERVKGNKLFLYTQKTGTPVYVPLPPAAVTALDKLNGDTEHFFTSGKASRRPPARTGRGISRPCSSWPKSRTRTRTGSATRLRCRCSKRACRLRTCRCCSAIRRFGSRNGTTNRVVKTLQKELEDEVRKAWA
jgi:site-specific recombinase XerD